MYFCRCGNKHSATSIESIKRLQQMRVIFYLSPYPLFPIFLVGMQVPSLETLRSYTSNAVSWSLELQKKNETWAECTKKA